MFDWSNSFVRAATFALLTITSALIGELADDLLLAGGLWVLVLASLGVATWWWRCGFKFPETLQPHINVRREPPDREFGIDLEMENPGRTDVFEVKIEDILGTKAPSPAVGAYPRWRGQAGQDKKLIRKGDSATFALCGWTPPDLSGSGPVEHEMVNVTVSASTGDTPATLSPAAANNAGLEDYGLVYRLRVISEKTEKQARYEVHVGPMSISDYNPRVSVTRRGLGS